MKGLTVVALALLASGAAILTPASALDMSGAWYLQARYASGGQTNATCVFEQGTIEFVGVKFFGACKGPYGFGPVSGTVRGDGVQFTYSFNPYLTHSAPFGQNTFMGELAPDGTLRGSALDHGVSPGQFIATRQ